MMPLAEYKTLLDFHEGTNSIRDIAARKELSELSKQSERHERLYQEFLKKYLSK